MKLMKVMLLAAVVLTSASAAYASGTMTFGLGGGITSPTGDFGKGSKMGFNGGVYGDYWIKPDYAFGVDIAGNFLKAKDGVLAKTIAYPNPELKTTLIYFGAHGVWAIPMQDAKIQPWITYGAGIYNFSSKLTGTAANVTNTQSKFGFNGGVGADIKASPVAKVGADFKYHYIMNAIQSGTSSSDKKAANYFTAGVHVTFSTNGGK